MPYIPPEVVQKAREMDLLTYLQNYEPQELVHFSGNTYCTRSHDSLKISNGKWCWWSQGIGGKSALDYLIKVRDMSFMDAVEQIAGRATIQPPIFMPKNTEPKEKTLILPKPKPSTVHAVSYLKNRGIADEILDFCISTGRLFEADVRIDRLGKTYTNAVFVGFDKSGKARYGNYRGIGTDFRGDVIGSDKHYSFAILATMTSDTLNLFESAIDLLSYASLRKLEGVPWQGENLLSLAGIYKPKQKIEDSKLPAALKQYLSDYPHIKQIVLRLDNDYAGRVAAKAIQTILPDEYAVSTQLSPQGKDYNDCLCIRKGLPITAKSERNYAR